MLVDCFLSLWFRGLINLGEYSKGKPTRSRALAVYKSGAQRSINKLFWRRCRGTIDLRSNLTCIRKYFLIFLFDLFRSLIFSELTKKTDLFHENQSNLEFVLFFFYVLDLVYSSFRSRIYFSFSLTPHRRWTEASPTNPNILWMIQKKFTGKGDEKHDQGSRN